MPSTYTTVLRLEKPASGDYDNTWDTVWNNTLALVEAAVGGYVTVVMPSDANYTLTTNNGIADEARNQVINVTSVSLSATRSIVIPNLEKTYIVINSTTGSQSITVATSSPVSTVTIPNGRNCMVYCDGSHNVVALGVLFPDGTAAAPGVTLFSDTNTGFYKVGEDQFGLSVGGGNVLTFKTTDVTSSKPIYVPNGTAAAPSVVSSADTNTGIYFSGSDAVVIAAGGTAQATFSTTAVTLVPALLVGTTGTVSAPIVSPSNDTNTGIYFSAADTVDVSAGGANVASFGTTAITANKAVIALAGSASTPSVTFSGDTNTGIYSSGADGLGIAAGGTNIVTVTTTGVTAAQPVVLPAGSNSAPSLTFAGDTNLGIYRSDTDELSVTAGGTQIVEVNSSGLNVTSGALSVAGTTVATVKAPVSVSSTPYNMGATASNTYFRVDASSGNIVVNLPAAASAGSGFTFDIQKIDSGTNTVTIDPNGSETIGGFATIVLFNQFDSLRAICNGSNWEIVSVDIMDYYELVTATNASYALKAGCAQVDVVVQGGGSGGSGADGSSSGDHLGAPGGSAGGEVEATIDSRAISTLSITIGAGGAGGSGTGGLAGSAGSDSVVTWSGGAVITAAGGPSPPAAGSATSTSRGFVGGAGGYGTIAGTTTAIMKSLVKAGMPGGMGLTTGSGAYVMSGFGANSRFGQGGAARSGNTDTNGNDAIGYGAGGGGAIVSDSTSNFNGGAGTAGCVLIRQVFGKRRG